MIYKPINITGEIEEDAAIDLALKKFPSLFEHEDANIFINEYYRIAYTQDFKYKEIRFLNGINRIVAFFPDANWIIFEKKNIFKNRLINDPFFS